MSAVEAARPRDEPPFLFHLKRVAKIALAIGALACAGLLGVLLWLAETQAGSYGQIVGAYARAEARLHYTLLVFGLAMATIAGLTTWAVALYSSFRVAGPLYRFARNLELEIAHGPTRPLPIRRSDRLQAEAAALQEAAAALERHHAALRAGAQEALRALDEPGAQGEAALQAALARMKELDQRARL